MTGVNAARLRVVFAGTPAFAVPSLLALTRSAHDVVAVYTQPDRRAGRGRRLRQSEVKLVACEAGIAVRQPVSLRGDGQAEQLARLEPDLMVVAAYGLLLPPEILAIPRLGCVNVHASLLPRWRGAAPVQYAILAGDARTGITLMQMDAGLDTGDELARCETAIGPDETAGELTLRLATLGGELLASNLDPLAAGALQPQPQDHAGVTYAPKISKKAAEIDWHLSAAEISRAVRAYNPWPVAQTGFGGSQLRIWRATPVDGNGGVPGEVVATGDECLDIATGAGCLCVTELQPAGKRRMTVSDFLNAHDPVGVVLGNG